MGTVVPVNAVSAGEGDEQWAERTAWHGVRLETMEAAARAATSDMSTLERRKAPR
jgi:hypothetical protein